MNQIKNILFTIVILFSNLLLSEDLKIAIIDTGTDINHNLLKPYIWTNSGETGLDKNNNDKQTNNIDDDGNGYIDDIHGWNFHQNNNNLSDNNGHGTHISGIVTQANALKSSPSQKVKLIILKYFDKNPEIDSIAHTIKAIEYAIKMKAHLINYSSGGYSQSVFEYRAIKRALTSKIVFVSAAGNEGENTDLKKYYPAGYNLTNILSVGAYDKKTFNLLPSSNFGIGSVDISTPGKNILSTMPGNKLGKLTGTSQATAYATYFLSKIILEKSLLKEPTKSLKYLTQFENKNRWPAGQTRLKLRLSDNDVSKIRTLNTSKKKGLSTMGNRIS